MTHVLVVDDDTAFGETLAVGLRRRGCDVAVQTSSGGALDALSTADVDVIVTDIAMRGVTGLELCARVAATRPDIPVIVMTAFGSMEAAVAAIRAGAYDFIAKPVELDALAIAVDRAARHRALGVEVKRLRAEVEGRPESDEVVGQSPAMVAVYDLVERVADSDASVLVTGESGTGKELVARALHRRSRRRAAPFVAVNCAAMPEGLLESELFGHVRGAFTDAKSAKDGLFTQAHGGTIFLDEIGDMPMALQPKLLRALQERTIRPVGARAEVPVDVRVIAATNRDLEAAIEEGSFRGDLFYRINVVQIALPPLRARAGDILPLAQHFVRAYARRADKDVRGISRAAAERLLAYAWPGNVRELQNCVERAVALARFDHISVDDLPEKLRDQRGAVIVATDDSTELVSMSEIERRYVLRVMEAVGGNKAAAARILGFDRKRLYRLLDRFGR